MMMMMSCSLDDVAPPCWWCLTERQRHVPPVQKVERSGTTQQLPHSNWALGLGSELGLGLSFWHGCQINKNRLTLNTQVTQELTQLARYNEHKESFLGLFTFFLYLFILFLFLLSYTYKSPTNCALSQGLFLLSSIYLNFYSECPPAIE